MHKSPHPYAPLWCDKLPYQPLDLAVGRIRGFKTFKMQMVNDALEVISLWVKFRHSSHSSLWLHQTMLMCILQTHPCTAKPRVFPKQHWLSMNEFPCWEPVLQVCFRVTLPAGSSCHDLPRADGLIHSFVVLSESQGQKAGECVTDWALATLWEKVNCQQTFPTSDIFCMESYAFNKEAAATAEQLINTGKLTS